MPKTPPRALEPPPSAAPVSADDLLEAVHQVMHLARNHHHAVLRDQAQGLTLLEGKVLGFFARNPGASAADLADHSGRDKGQLTRLLNGLKARDLLLVQPDPVDRRVQRLSLAPTARVQLDALKRQRRRVAEQAAGGLSVEERHALHALLQRLAHNLNAG